jgi:PhnB protein
MSTSVPPIPKGYSQVTPYLVVDDAAKMIDFLRDAFDAKELRRMAPPGGKIGHAEVRIGDSMIMLADANSQFTAGRTGIHLYLPDVDEVYQRALRAGATTLRAPENQFYGDRSAVVRDAWGNWWSISTHIEDVSDEEMARRAQALHAKAAQ